MLWSMSCIGRVYNANLSGITSFLPILLMSSLMINFVTFGRKSPIAILACKWLLASMCPHVMPEACPLWELTLTSLKSAPIGLCFLDSLRVSRKIRAAGSLWETRLPTSGGFLLVRWNHFFITLTIFFTFVRNHNIIRRTARIRVRMLFVEFVSFLWILTWWSGNMWCY